MFAGPFESELINGFSPATTPANIFDAIGELATSKTGAPIKTVVLHEKIVQENPRMSIDAIRSIDPSAIIVYSGRHNHQHADASNKFFSRAGRLATLSLASLGWGGTHSPTRSETQMRQLSGPRPLSTSTVGAPRVAINGAQL